jgi:hypothetical protein
MLRKNPLQPPRPFTAAPSAAASVAQPAQPPGFLVAEDFDSTGIMAGVDPAESRYWWVPELYGPEAGPETAEPPASAAAPQATSRAGSRAAAAA